MQAEELYVKPNMDVLSLENADVVTLSNWGNESNNPTYEDVNDMFK